MQSWDDGATTGFLFTDQYQLTMAQLYFRTGMHETQSMFDYFFRDYPDYGNHKAGYCITAGLEWFTSWMLDTRITAEETSFLHSQKNRAGKGVFQKDFLHWLSKNGDFRSLSLRAVPEGRVVHPHAPQAVIEGPLAIAQIAETSLLNFLNFQTLIATKASRIREVCQSQLILEFGARRGHGRGVIAGARAALIGGADFTSNVGISHALGLQPGGTHAHSMVQVFLAMGMSERDAFDAYADVYPDDCLLLVDTIDTLHSGLPNAIAVFERLRSRGHAPVGIRLDSGDLAFLSIQAAKMLDLAGFEATTITLSNELDELTIWQIISQIGQEAPRHGVDADRLIKRLAFGVGTRLITSYGASALGGVFKLVAIRDAGAWKPAMKLSESRSKIPLPGRKQVWRVYDAGGNATADVIGLDDEVLDDDLMLHHVVESTKSRILDAGTWTSEPLLVDIVREGALVYPFPGDLAPMREQRAHDVGRLTPGVRRLMNPHIYHVSLTEDLWEMKEQLIRSMQAGSVLRV
jgi:nicotinate phosphoribosyltransferase